MICVYMPRLLKNLFTPLSLQVSVSYLTFYCIVKILKTDLSDRENVYQRVQFWYNLNHKGVQKYPVKQLEILDEFRREVFSKNINFRVVNIQMAFMVEDLNTVINTVSYPYKQI